MSSFNGEGSLINMYFVMKGLIELFLTRELTSDYFVQMKYKCSATYCKVCKSIIYKPNIITYKRNIIICKPNIIIYKYNIIIYSLILSFINEPGIYSASVGILFDLCALEKRCG